MPSSFTQWIDRKFYPSHSRNWDDKLFRERILSHLNGTPKDILDLGAGAGIIEDMNFREQANSVTGIDPDERVRENPYLDEGIVGLGDNLPFADNRFDIVFSDNVLEHLPDPAKVFAEIARVTKPGGVFLGKTPNQTHYMPIIASLTPHWFHQWMNKKRGRDEVDTFPTIYLANSPRKIKQLARQSGLEVTDISLIEGRPEYMRFTLMTYVLGMLYERLVNVTSLLSGFRILLVIELRKPL